jgi:very-short-patch-repair endonuclease
MATERRIPPNSQSKSDARWKEREDRLLNLARRQHGVVSIEQLRSLGFTDSAARYRASTGRLHRVHAGVYALGRPDLPAKGRWMAAVLACGPGAVLSHASAAALHGIRPSAASRIDITVPRPYPITRPGTRVRRRNEPTAADITEVEGIPVTSVPRTLLDLATILSDHQLERACEQAVLEGVFDLNAISELLSRSHGVRGIRRFRRILARGDLGGNIPASELERRFRDLCANAGLPAPEINRHLLLGDTYHQVDFLWRRERVVIEVDGRRYHSTGWQRRRDAERDALLPAHGYSSARISGDQINHRPTQALATAGALLNAARDPYLPSGARGAAAPPASAPRASR